MVIGADRSDVVSQGLRQAQGAYAVRLGVGFAVSVAVMRLLVFRTSAEAAVVLKWAGAAASYVPARGAPGWIRCAAPREE